MIPTYSNWLPKRLKNSFITGTFICWIFIFASRIADIGVLKAISILAFLLCLAGSLWCIYAYNMLSFEGKSKVVHKIIGRIQSYADVPQNGKCLDVDCKSGELAIELAKSNKTASCIGAGITRYNKRLCEKNAFAEDVENIAFVKGSRELLDFDNEYFDFVGMCGSPYALKSKSDTQLLSEAVRVLKQGGTFAFCDSMSKYGGTEQLHQLLTDNGCQSVEFVDVIEELGINEAQAKRIFITDVKIVVVKK